MNNIHEEDWAADSWGGHTGMGNDSDYSRIDDDRTEDQPGSHPGPRSSSQA